MTTYTVASDFHQNAQGLKYLFEKYSDTQIVLLGDFFDSHGDENMADAKTMAETLVECYNHAQIKPLIIRGDHDDFIIGAAKANKKSISTWKLNNGKQTLKEFGYNAKLNADNIAEFLNTSYPDLINILNQSQLIIEKPNIIFVHGGLDWSKQNPVTQTSAQNAMWLRGKYIYNYFYYLLKEYTGYTLLWRKPWYHRNKTDKTIVSGHTPTHLINAKKKNNIIAIHNKHDLKDVNRYFIDGGSGYPYTISHLNIAQFNEQGTLINKDTYTY